MVMVCDAVAALGLVDDRVHPVEHTAEDRVAAVEVRLRRVGDEELRAAGVGPGEGHAHRAARVLLQIDLVADRVAGAAVHVVARIAALDHEVRHDAHERSCCRSTCAARAARSSTSSSARPASAARARSLPRVMWIVAVCGCVRPAARSPRTPRACASPAAACTAAGASPASVRCRRRQCAGPPDRCRCSRCAEERLALRSIDLAQMPTIAATRASFDASVRPAVPRP